jgi:hypothetical protein
MLKRIRVIVLGAATMLLTAAGPPPTATVEHVETLFGMTFNDPYYWMEAGGPTFDDWLSAQAGYTRQRLDAIPGRAALLTQLHSLNSGETRVGAVLPAGRQWIYSQIRPSDSTAKIFTRPMTDGTEHVLIDPSQFDTGSQGADIDYWSASPDARYLVYGVSLGGGEIGTLRIRRIETGVDLPEQIDRTRYAGPTWTDDTTFLYTRLPEAPPGVVQSFAGGQVYLHRLGDNPNADVLVFGPGNIAGQAVGPNFVFRGLASPDSTTIVGIYDTGLTSSPKAVFVAAKAELGERPCGGKLRGLTTTSGALCCMAICSTCARPMTRRINELFAPRPQLLTLRMPRRSCPRELGRLTAWLRQRTRSICDAAKAALVSSCEFRGAALRSRW